MRSAIAIMWLGAALGASAPAAASGTCSDHRAGCEAVCTPARIARYYAGSPRRCTASCEPRWQQCLRTGWWADLEAISTGGWEPAPRF